MELSKSADVINCLNSQIKCKEKEIESLKKLTYKDISVWDKEITDWLAKIESQINNTPPEDKFIHSMKAILFDDIDAKALVSCNSYPILLSQSLKAIHTSITQYRDAKKKAPCTQRRSSVSPSRCGLSKSNTISQTSRTSHKKNDHNSSLYKPIFDSFSKKRPGYFDPYIQYGGPTMYTTQQIRERC
jgi:hypothetical protein